MLKLYKKSDLWFTIILIIVYSILQTVANYLNQLVGIESFFHAIFNIILTIVLFIWIKKNGLLEKYGLCKANVHPRLFLFYIPLIIIITHNLWNGFAINFNGLDMVCYICYMLFVGFVEEILFRGFLFKAIGQDNIKLAIVISSVTFGLGHFLHLVDGSGIELVANVCQVIGAVAVGFLFVIIFHRGGSLIPCIIVHSLIDAVSAFANENGLTVEKRIIFSAISTIIVVVYTLVLLKILPKKDVVIDKE